MMDRIKELLEKIPYTLVVIALLGWTGWSYYRFTSGGDSERNAKQAELDTVQKETDAIQAKIKAANEFYRSLDQKTRRAAVARAAARRDARQSDRAARRRLSGEDDRHRSDQGRLVGGRHSSDDV